MKPSLPIQYNYSLRNHNTFGIDAKARAYLSVTDLEQLQVVRHDEALSKMPRLVLGGGSNVLLTDDFDGLVLHLCNSGIEVIGEDADAVYIRAAAGENWHRFVLWTLAHGFGGLENLSLIPGSVGASPIQNIGAYGVEVKDCLDSVTIFDFDSGSIGKIDNAACRFGYRDSVFKHELKDRAIVISVTFALPKQWKPNIRYTDVAQELAARGFSSSAPLPTPHEISDAVIAIRTRKLPDPAQIGNAGSFFKNPIVHDKERLVLLAQYPQLVNYEQPDGTYKLAAGWLIDQCGWKGKSAGTAGVYEKQALVLVNRGKAKGQDIVALARSIQEDVHKQFGVWLEPEPVFV
jgi:UDP-N-acetylmuramate dehydrogenase